MKSFIKRTTLVMAVFILLPTVALAVNGNTFFGDGAGVSITTGINNTLIGENAGENLTTGRGTFIGKDTGLNTTTGGGIFIGEEAGFSNTTGGGIFIGRKAGFSSTTICCNTFIGDFSGNSTTIGNANTFVGQNSGYYNTTGYNNTFLGDQAGRQNDTGFDNTFIGQTAGHNNQTGILNTFIGRSAGGNNSIGNENTFVGRESGIKNINGSENTFIGLSAGKENVSGNRNTAIGYQAGYSSTNGEGNVFIGYKAGITEQHPQNKLFIENSDSPTPLIYGDFATDEVTINSTLKTTTFCLSGDCRTAWPAGGGGSTTVDKDEINNAGVLGFEWNDSEVSDNLTLAATGITGLLIDSQIDDSLTIDATGSVDIGALPVSTTGITNGNATEVATVDDIYDFVLANAGTPSLWTESGADIYRPTGKVGIGTSTPSATLDVDGNTKLRGEVRADGLLILTPMSESIRPACNSTTEGAISYSKNDDKFYGCNGKKWKKLN